jgi:hypothetical protein
MAVLLLAAIVALGIKWCTNKEVHYIREVPVHKSVAPRAEDTILVPADEETDARCTSQRCRGTTKEGRRCRNATRNCHGYCHVHKWQIE